MDSLVKSRRSKRVLFLPSFSARNLFDPLFKLFQVSCTYTRNHNHHGHQKGSCGSLSSTRRSRCKDASKWWAEIHTVTELCSWSFLSCKHFILVFLTTTFYTFHHVMLNIIIRIFVIWIQLIGLAIFPNVGLVVSLVSIFKTCSRVWIQIGNAHILTPVKTFVFIW